MRKVECARTHTDIVFDDLLFLMREVPHGYDEEWSISMPQLAKHKASVADPEILKMPQNLALIRTLQIQSREKVDISEKFFLAIYNDELNVVAGIRFEKIS
jgi:hypothetical protein